MLALEPLIQARLRDLSALTGWAIRGACTAADRRSVPAADVRMGAAGASDVRQGAVALQPRWAVQLIVRRGDEAAGQLDSAMSAAIEALHNWRPGNAGGRGWDPLQVADVSEAAVSDAGLIGYEITFTTVARFDGQP